MQLARTFHESGARIDATFDFYRDGLGYERLLKGYGNINIPGYDELREKVTRLNEYCTADEGFSACFCHNDYLPLNFLIGEDGSMSVIDWEFAGMGDPGNDTATFIICSQYNEEQANAAIDAYFGRAATPLGTRGARRLVLVRLGAREGCRGGGRGRVARHLQELCRHIC